MKLIKTKLATGLVLGAVMFGMLSFTTTPIAAQETSSNTSATATDDQKALGTLLFKAALKGLAAGLGAIAGGWLAGNETLVSDYPANALD